MYPFTIRASHLRRPPPPAPPSRRRAGPLLSPGDQIHTIHERCRQAHQLYNKAANAGGGAGGSTMIAVEKLRHHELQQWCKGLGLPTAGSTQQLRDRMTAVLPQSSGTAAGRARCGTGKRRARTSGSSRSPGGRGRSASPSPRPAHISAPLLSARRLSRDTSLAYLLPALTAAHLQLPKWEQRSAGFAAVSPQSTPSPLLVAVLRDMSGSSGRIAGPLSRPAVGAVGLKIASVSWQAAFFALIHHAYELEVSIFVACPGFSTEQCKPCP